MRLCLGVLEPVIGIGIMLLWSVHSLGLGLELPIQPVFVGWDQANG